MKLSDEQWEFLKDIARLILWAEENGYKMTEGEGYRTADQQMLYFYGFAIRNDNGRLSLVEAEKRSKTMNSSHMERLAHDFNVFVHGKLTYDADAIRPLGEYWKSLNSKNVWGGDWGWDAGHFERRR